MCTSMWIELGSLFFHVIDVCTQLDILLNGRVVDALASVVHRDKAYSTGKTLCVKLKDTIHRYGMCRHTHTHMYTPFILPTWS